MNAAKKLARVIGVKERIRKVRRSELAEAEEAARIADEHHRQATNIQLGAIHHLIARGETTGDELARRAMIVAMADKFTARAKAVLNDCMAEQNRRRDATIEASREVRVLETLHARIEKRIERDARVREQVATDEIAGSRRARNRS